VVFAVAAVYAAGFLRGHGDALHRRALPLAMVMAREARRQRPRCVRWRSQSSLEWLGSFPSLTSRLLCVLITLDTELLRHRKSAAKEESMAISRWSPVSDLVALHNTMDRLFSDSFAGRGRGRRQDDVIGVAGEGFLPLDVYQTEKEWVIRAGVPNVDPENVEVTCDGNTIRIVGEIKPPEDNKSQDYWMRENYYGSFSREVTLPEETVCEQSKAEFRNGMLVLTLPKAQPTKHQVKKIPVTAGEAGATKKSIAAGSATGAQSATQQREPQGAGRK
jgi:HSP20 family protein